MKAFLLFVLFIVVFYAAGVWFLYHEMHDYIAICVPVPVVAVLLFFTPHIAKKTR